MIFKLLFRFALFILPTMDSLEMDKKQLNKDISWQTEMREAIRNLHQLKKYLSENTQSKELIFDKLNNDQQLSNLATQYPLFLPQRLLNKIILLGKHSPLYRQFIPSELEQLSSLQQTGLTDPIGDQDYQVTQHLIHRYQNRALFLPTNICPTICRYCFRKNELYEGHWGQVNLIDTREYLMKHTEINEIIFTGGDPLSLSNEKINSYLHFFREFDHIKFIRFHTRFPMIIPSRIDHEFCQVIEQHQAHFYQISMAIHCNHYSEFDSDVFDAVKKLKTTNIQLLSQTVLLNHINADVDSLIELFKTFIQIGIRPYYLHHPDLVKGAMHFRINLEQGRKIYQQLRHQLPGWAIPQYVVDLPNGQGKTPAYNPENFEFSGEFINRFNQKAKYVDNQ